MSEPMLARVAGAAFGGITGADLKDPELERDEFPEDPENSITDANATEAFYESTLPWPDVENVAAWLGTHGGRFAPDARHLNGRQAWSYNDFRDSDLRYQAQFRAMSIELAMRSPSAALPNWHAPVVLRGGSFRRAWQGAPVLLENATPFEAELTGGFERSGHEYVVVATKGTFVLPRRSDDPCLLAEKQEPLFFSDVFGPDPEVDAVVHENDFAPFKPRCDVLVDGPAIAPGDRPVTELPVGMRLGTWTKQFVALGARVWLDGVYGFRVSDKRPFLRQDIGYDQADGGIDPLPDTPGHARTYETNPAGVGYYPVHKDLAGLALPQTCQRGEDSVNREGDYVPKAFGPLGRAWLPRRKWAGTYDEAWMNERMPFLPDDFDDRYFQAAAPDQWVPYPKGGEPLQILNLSETSQISTHLPQLSVVMSFTRKSGRVTQKIANLDTVLVMAEAMRLCLTWRARLVLERDMFEVADKRHRPRRGATDCRVERAVTGGPAMSVIGYGMWTAAGHDGPSTVAAMRAGVSGAERANLWDYTVGDNLSAFRVHAHQWWEGPTFLPDLAHPVIEECRARIPEDLGVDPADVPILLGVAPKDRPDRAPELERILLDGLAEKDGRALPAGSGVVPGGRVALPHLLTRASELVSRVPLAIVVGVESFLRQRIVEHYIERGRLLCGTNSSGFIVGEAVAGLIVAPSGRTKGPELRILGMGAGYEPSKDGGSKEEPVRAVGLTEAMREALRMSGTEFYDIPLIMADLNGEHFKFKELALATMRVDRLPPEGRSRRPREHVEYWNVVETIGDVGAALLPAAMGWGFEAGRSGYLPGRALFAAGEDDGARVALIGEMGNG